MRRTPVKNITMAIGTGSIGLVGQVTYYNYLSISPFTLGHVQLKVKNYHVT